MKISETRVALRILGMVCFCLAVSKSGAAEPLDIGKITKEPKVGAEYSLPINRTELMFDQNNGRRFMIPISLKGKRAIKLTIWRGNDNTGDGGMTWRLVDSASNKELATGVSRIEKARRWTIKEITSSNVILILEDKDTKFEGKVPGNRIAVAVSLAK